MTAPARKLSSTFAEYLALETASEAKHELVNGEIYAMAGGTPEHGRLCTNVSGELRNAIAGRPCVTFNSDVRVRVRATGLTTYPDASVVCGPTEVDPDDKNTITNPIVLVEVLSDSTEAYGRDDKRAHYRLIPSLRDYLMVSQHQRRITHWHRNDDDTWTVRDVGAGGRVRLEAIGGEIAVDAVYHDPRALPPPPPQAGSRSPGTPRRKKAPSKRAPRSKQS